jgi:hypothetical protein
MRRALNARDASLAIMFNSIADLRMSARPAGNGSLILDLLIHIDFRFPLLKWRGVEPLQVSTPPRVNLARRQVQQYGGNPYDTLERVRAHGGGLESPLTCGSRWGIEPVLAALSKLGAKRFHTVQLSNRPTDDNRTFHSIAVYAAAHEDR